MLANTLLLVIYVSVAPAQVTPVPVQAVWDNPAVTPMRITAMVPAPVPARVPADVAAKSIAFQVTVANTTYRGVMAYAIQYVFENASGSQLVKECFSSQAYNPGRPRIAPAAGATLDAIFARRPEATRVRPVIDLVLLDDGTYYGENNCRALDRYQTVLQDRRVLQGVILRYLESHGAERTIEMLRAELARQNTTDPPLLNATKWKP